MTNLMKSHTFIVRKANGTHDFRIQLRASYWNTITSERRLRAALERAIEWRMKVDLAYATAIKKHYDNNNILYILREFGMISGSERIN